MRGISIDLGLLRTRRGLSQRRLAELAGLRPATLSALERGKTRSIDFDTLAKLCAVLDCVASDILVLEKDPHVVPVLGGPDEDEIIAERLAGLDLAAIAADPGLAGIDLFDDDEDAGDAPAIWNPERVQIVRVGVELVDAAVMAKAAEGAALATMREDLDLPAGDVDDAGRAIAVGVHGPPRQ